MFKKLYFYIYIIINIYNRRVCENTKFISRINFFSRLKTFIIKKIKFKIIKNKLIIKLKFFEKKSKFKIITINLIIKLKKFLKIFKNIFNNFNGNFNGNFIDFINLISYNNNYNSAFINFTKRNINIFKFLKNVKIKDILLSNLNIYNNNDKYNKVII